MVSAETEPPTAKPANWRAICATARKSPGSRECVVADAVDIEPVSASKFPVNGNLQGIFRFCRDLALGSNQIDRRDQVLGPRIPCATKQRIFAWRSGKNAPRAAKSRNLRNWRRTEKSSALAWLIMGAADTKTVHVNNAKTLVVRHHLPQPENGSANAYSRIVPLGRFDQASRSGPPGAKEIAIGSPVRATRMRGMSRH